jgi:hypothetical protein
MLLEFTQKVNHFCKQSRFVCLETQEQQSSISKNQNVYNVILRAAAVPRFFGGFFPSHFHCYKTGKERMYVVKECMFFHTKLIQHQT